MESVHGPVAGTVSTRHWCRGATDGPPGRGSCCRPIWYARAWAKGGLVELLRAHGVTHVAMNQQLTLATSIDSRLP
jgi:hypothetical protein